MQALNFIVEARQMYLDLISPVHQTPIVGWVTGLSVWLISGPWYHVHGTICHAGIMLVLPEVATRTLLDPHNTDRYTGIMVLTCLLNTLTE